jgi:serine/threonine protein kinase
MSSDWGSVIKYRIGGGTNGNVYVCNQIIYFASGKCWNAEGRVIKQLIESKHYKSELHCCKLLSKHHFQNLLNVIDVEESLGLVLFEEKMDVDLFEYILDEENDLSIKDMDESHIVKQKLKHLIPIFQQIANGLKELHDFGFAHMDLKLENILYSKSTHTVKICDFAFTTASPLTKDFKGTIDYLAPEMCLPDFYDPKKADMYSLGILIFASLTGLDPYNQNKLDACKTKEELYEVKSEKIHFPKNNISSQLKELVRNLTKVNPEERITINQCIQELNNIRGTLN